MAYKYETQRQRGWLFTYDGNTFDQQPVGT
jgi:hypothetical protein